MRPILEKLRSLCPKLPPAASPQELCNFEKSLGRRLPGALRALYQDHNGELGGALLYRLLPLHDAYPVSEGVWCFWEDRYDPSAAGADYHFTDGSVYCDDQIFPSIQAFLQHLVDHPLSEAPPRPEAFVRAESLNCSERTAALIEALAQAPAEAAPSLLQYLSDEDEAVVAATCDWMAHQRITGAIRSLALNCPQPCGRSQRSCSTPAKCQWGNLVHNQVIASRFAD